MCKILGWDPCHEIFSNDVTICLKSHVYRVCDLFGDIRILTVLSLLYRVEEMG